MVRPLAVLEIVHRLGDLLVENIAKYLPLLIVNALDPGEGFWIKVNDTPFIWDYPRSD